MKAPVKYLFSLMAGAALAAFLYRIRAVLVPFVAAGAIAYLIDPLVSALERRGAPRSAGTVIVYLGTGVVMLLLCLYLFPSFLRQLQELADILPGHAMRLQARLSLIYERFDRLRVPEPVRVFIDDAITRGEQHLREAARRAVEGLMGILSHSLGLIITPVLAFYITRDMDRIRGRVAGMLLARGRGDIIRLVGQIDGVLSEFVRGQLLVGAVVGGLTAIGLTLMHVEFALVIGILAGILDMIPYFGPLLGAIPAVAAALLVSPWTALWVALMLLAIQELEGAVIAPKILGDRVGLHPLVVIFAVLAGAEVFGFAGLLIGVPLAAILKIVVGFIAEKLQQ
ncbi:MAG TPA: AI-2E family transporter [Firmicutes bacterium]|nr:AI-2E family transporter [Bacillota bacterium]